MTEITEVDIFNLLMHVNTEYIDATTQKGFRQLRFPDLSIDSAQKKNLSLNVF